MTRYATNYDPDTHIFGPWEHVARELRVTKVPSIVNGFGRTISTKRLDIEVTHERRKVWQFVGYEDRAVES